MIILQQQQQQQQNNHIHNNKNSNITIMPDFLGNLSILCLVNPINI